MTRRTCRDCARDRDGICPKHEAEAEAIFDGDFEDRDVSGRAADHAADLCERAMHRQWGQ